MCIHTSKNNSGICRDFLCLVDSNEAVPSSHSSWNMREAGNLKLYVAPWLHEDAKSVLESKDNVRMSRDSGSFSDESEEEKLCENESETTFEYQHSQNEKEVKEMENGATGLVIFDERSSNPHLYHNDVPTEHNHIELKKKIKSLAKKIKHFEDDFEIEFGYRPSHSEMRKYKDIKKYMSELSKGKKELKQMKNLVHTSSVQEFIPSGSGEIISCQGSAGATITLQKLERRLEEERSACGRIENIAVMTLDELQDEKTSLQKALLYYESTHGRPKSKEERDLAKPLYDRYRKCKRYVSRAGSHDKENMRDLATIIEHETMYHTQISPPQHGCINQSTVEDDTFMDPPHLVDKDETCSSEPLGGLHSLPLRTLKVRKKEVKEEKKRLKKVISDFEEHFERENGRKFHKEDRAPLEQTYLDYKYSKAKLRLIEALLTKLQPLRY